MDRREEVWPTIPTCTAGLGHLYLVIPTAATIHSRIQLGVTGPPHGAPECVADILQVEGKGHTLTPPGAPSLPSASLGPLLCSLGRVVLWRPEAQLCCVEQSPATSEATGSG